MLHTIDYYYKTFSRKFIFVHSEHGFHVPVMGVKMCELFEIQHWQNMPAVGCLSTCVVFYLSVEQNIYILEQLALTNDIVTVHR